LYTEITSTTNDPVLQLMNVKILPKLHVIMRDHCSKNVLWFPLWFLATGKEKQSHFKS